MIKIERIASLFHCKTNILKPLKAIFEQTKIMHAMTAAILHNQTYIEIKQPNDTLTKPFAAHLKTVHITPLYRSTNYAPRD